MTRLSFDGTPCNFIRCFNRDKHGGVIKITVLPTARSEAHAVRAGEPRRRAVLRPGEPRMPQTRSRVQSTLQRDQLLQLTRGAAGSGRRWRCRLSGCRLSSTGTRPLRWAAAPRAGLPAVPHRGLASRTPASGLVRPHARACPLSLPLESDTSGHRRKDAAAPPSPS